jgi:hypothetical protein
MKEHYVLYDKNGFINGSMNRVDRDDSPKIDIIFILGIIAIIALGFKYFI